jgi:hypothetical protein
MSASNWNTCPKCLHRAKEEQAEAIRLAKNSYGKVPEEEYASLCQEAAKPLDVPTSLREDYEIGITEAGKFFVIYSGYCSQCDFVYTFNHEQKVFQAHDKD